MSEPPSLDLAAYHENAVEQIADFLDDDVEVVASYPRFEDRIPAKAVTIGLDSFTPENPDDLGTEQFHADMRFEAFVFVSYLEDDYELLVRKIATKLMAWIYGKRFGCPVGPAKIISANPDAMQLPGRVGRDGEAQDYVVWRIEWSHEVLIGESVWDNEGTQPIEVWVSGPGGETVNLLAE